MRKTFSIRWNTKKISSQLHFSGGKSFSSNCFSFLRVHTVFFIAFLPPRLERKKLTENFHSIRKILLVLSNRFYCSYFFFFILFFLSYTNKCYFCNWSFVDHWLGKKGHRWESCFDILIARYELLNCFTWLGWNKTKIQICDELLNFYSWKQKWSAILLGTYWVSLKFSTCSKSEIRTGKLYAAGKLGLIN